MMCNKNKLRADSSCVQRTHQFQSHIAILKKFFKVTYTDSFSEKATNVLVLN